MHEDRVCGGGGYLLEEEQRRLERKKAVRLDVKERLAAPRILERGGCGKIAAASDLNGNLRADSINQVRELLQRARDKDGSTRTSSCCCCRGWDRTSRQDLSWLGEEQRGEKER